MIARLLSSLCCLLPLLFLASGCATEDELFLRRVSERSAVFNALSSEDQARLRRGIVRPGDTQDAVWIAHGDPTHIYQRVTAGCTNELWSYAFRVREEDNRNRAYWTSHPVVSPNGGVGWVHDPVVWMGETVREVDYLRVELNSNIVTVVETPTGNTSSDVQYP